MTRPSDRAIAMAFWEKFEGAGAYAVLDSILNRAREIDATTPQAKPADGVHRDEHGFEEWYAANAFDYAFGYALDPIGSRDCRIARHAWHAALDSTTPEAKPAEPLPGVVAYLHEVTAGDGEPDQALSFQPDSFPLEGVAGYRTVSVRPLVCAAEPLPGWYVVDRHGVSEHLIDKKSAEDDAKVLNVIRSDGAPHIVTRLAPWTGESEK